MYFTIACFIDVLVFGVVSLPYIFVHNVMRSTSFIVCIVSQYFHGSVCLSRFLYAVSSFLFFVMDVFVYLDKSYMKG